MISNVRICAKCRGEKYLVHKYLTHAAPRRRHAPPEGEAGGSGGRPRGRVPCIDGRHPDAARLMQSCMAVPAESDQVLRAVGSAGFSSTYMMDGEVAPCAALLTGEAVPL